MRRQIPPAIRQAVYALKGHKCDYCEVDLLALPKRDRTLDHIVLAVDGGSETVDNLVPACRSCNSARGRMTPEQLRFYVKNKADYRARLGRAEGKRLGSAKLLAAMMREAAIHTP